MIAVLILIIALIVIYRIDNKRLDLEIKVAMLEAETESLDAGRRSWRAEAKHRRGRMVQLRKELSETELHAAFLAVDNYTLLAENSALVDTVAELKKKPKATKKVIKKTKK